jgi:hypothetical protein
MDGAQRERERREGEKKERSRMYFLVACGLLEVWLDGIEWIGLDLV